MVLNRNIFTKFEIALSKYRARFVSANLAQPGKQQCFTPITAHFPDHDTHGALHDFLCQLLVVINARKRETKQPWKILTEKYIKCPLITGRHVGGQRPVLLYLGDTLSHFSYSGGRGGPPLP